VVVNYLDDEEGAGLTREKAEAVGRLAIMIGAEVSDEEQIREMFDRAVEEFGTVDALMNNAGVDASGTEVRDRATKTNVYGYFYCCRWFINIRKQAGGGGNTINITSVHQEQPRAGATDYDCFKGAIRNLAPHKINVNNIGPGMVLTSFNQEAIDDPDVREQQVQSIPWKRAAFPEEIGRLAVFLASDEADHVTGSTYYMDGGLMQNAGQGA